MACGGLSQFGSKELEQIPVDIVFPVQINAVVAQIGHGGDQIGDECGAVVGNRCTNSHYVVITPEHQDGFFAICVGAGGNISGKGGAVGGIPVKVGVERSVSVCEHPRHDDMRQAVPVDLVRCQKIALIGNIVASDPMSRLWIDWWFSTSLCGTENRYDCDKGKECRCNAV